MKAKLLPGASAATQDERPPSGSLEAYNALLEGRFYLNRNTESDLRKAIGFFTEATRIDPRYALAWAELGRTLNGLAGEYLDGAPSREANARALAATEKALALDPLKANWYNWLAGYLSGAHRLDEAEQAIRKAIELQPAAASFREELAVILIQRGEAAAALHAAQQEPAGVWQDVALALARQAGPDRSAADAALKTLISKDGPLASYQIAEVYALRGDASTTFQWLDRAWSNRDPGTEYLLYDPFILRYQGDPRFAAFCRKVGLPLPGAKPTHTSR